MLDELDYPAERLEFIVVDNASSDGTADMLRRDFPQIRVIENANVGAAGWTRGFEAGRGDYFLVLDDDCYLRGDALIRAVDAAEARDADLVSFRVTSSQDPDFEFASHYPVGLLSFWGCAALVSRRAVERLGGYDPNIFIWGNELDFTIRLLDARLRHLFLAEVVAIHMKAPPEGHSAAVYQVHTRHLGYVVTKLLTPRDAVVALTNLAAKVALGSLVDPSRWRVLGALASGVWLGLGARQPVRKVVSRTYRRNLRDVSSVLNYLGVVRELPAGRPSLRARLDAEHQRFCARRTEFYPTGTAVLELP